MNKYYGEMTDINKYYGEMVDIYICRALAAKNGGECLSDNFSSWRTKLRWQCKEGHEWESLYGNIKYGSWCPKCRSAENGRKRMKNNLSRAQEAATAKGGRCLADQSFPVNHTVGWECQNGHQWKALLSNVINNGTWCPKCSRAEGGRKRMKNNLSRAQETATAKGGRCLADQSFPMKHTVGWECQNGHQWKAILNNVINRGSWCPKCFIESRRKDNLSKAHMLAAAKGGLCLATENFTTITYVKWECAEGHQWETAFRVVMRGSWCPKCARVKIHKNCLHDDLSHGREIAAHGDSL